MNGFMKKYTAFLLLIVFQVVNIFGSTYIFAGVESTPIQTENIDSWIVPDKVMVKYKDENQQSTNVTSMSVNDGVDAETMPFVQEVVPQDTTVWEHIENLEALPNVDKVEPVFRMRATGIPAKQIKGLSDTASVLPNDPLLYDKDTNVNQWGLFDTEILDIWKYVSQEKRAEIIVAVLDTGVDLDHEDLKDSMIAGRNIIKNNANPQDENGHGTHVAGIIGAVANNGLGIAGAASGVKIMPVQVLDKYGLGDNKDIIAGIKWAVDQGANVINLSLGRPRFFNANGTKVDSRSEAEEEAIAYARNRGVIIIAATGNESNHYGKSGAAYKKDVNYPAAYEGVMAVGAVESYIEDGQVNYQIAGFSNVGDEVDVVAPGVGILSTFLLNKDATSPLVNQRYKYDDGTSMATPFVAALAALLKAADPDLLPDDITNIIKESAVDLGDSGFDQYYGAGLINAKNAFEFPRLKMNIKNTDIDENVYITDHGIDFDVVGYQADGSTITVTSAVYGEASIYASTINTQTLQFINEPSIKVQSVDMGVGRGSNSFTLDKIGGYFIWADDGIDQPYIQSRGYLVVRIPRAPLADAASGTYSLPKTVRLSSTEGGKIYYTLDGSTPSKDSTEYVGAITITDTMKIRAIVIGTGFGGEDISSKEVVLEYTKQPSSETQAPVIPIDSSGGSPGSVGGGGAPGGAPGGGGDVPENQVSGNIGAIPKIEVDDGNVIKDIYTPSVKVNKDDTGATIIRAEVATEKIRQMLKNHSKPAIVIQIPSEPSEGTLEIEMKGELFDLARDHNKYLLLQTKGVDIEIRPDMLKNISKDSSIVLKSKSMRSTQWEQINKTKITNAKIVSDIYDFELLVDNKSVKTFDIPMVLSFKLNLSSITNSSRVGIYYLNEQKNIWEYIGGKVKAANTITGSVEHFSKYTVMEYTRSFTDMSTHWAKEDVEILAAQHIVQGQNDLFYPNRNITRAEVAALISRSLNLKTKDIESPFKDVSSTDWYYEDINKVWQAGIVQGNSKDTFSPNEKISREEIAVMLTRAYAYSTKKDLKQISLSAVVRYKDQMKASEWAQWNIQLAHGLGLMKGYSDENFQPKSNATRAEVATSIRRLQGKIE